MLVVQNPDRPDRPVNSPQWNYQVTTEALAVIRLNGTPAFDAALVEYLKIVPGLKARHASARELNRIPVTAPGGKPFALSPGGQYVLIKQMIEEFCTRFTPGGELLYVGDADDKWALFEADRLAQLGVTVDQHGKMPDVVVYLPARDWLVLMEAASSHGPVHSSRRGELAALFGDATPGIVYVSCFPDRREMRKYLHEIAWETDVWCAEDPTHLIHFNGERFLGPHR
jgi:BsuBI/PstI restriction endonuclease domain/BsuBI/PstI restriction endonuclease HTH domain